MDKDGNVIATMESWLADTNGARSGITMPGTILIGGGYYEEIAPVDSAPDKTRIKKIIEGCEAGMFNFKKQYVEIFNTSDCDPTLAEEKVYTAGIGNIKDDDLEITKFRYVKGHRYRHGHDHGDD